MPANETPAENAAPESGFELYIMRHGIAVARDSGAFADDSKRPLTPEGKRKTQENAKGLLRLGLELDWIVTSPLVRAVETAEIVGESFKTSVPMDFCTELRPGGSPEAVMSFLAKHHNRRRVLLVGHEPGLSHMAARLLGAGHQTHLAFKKGGCCLIAFEDSPPRSPGQLVWWLTPRVMRKMR